MHRVLSNDVTCYRIGDPKGDYPVFSGEGSRFNPGRWNEHGEPMIYTSEHYSTAMLEKLVHYSGDLPEGQHFVEISIQKGTSYETFSRDHYPDWHKSNQLSAKAFGSDWFKAGRSAILFVPSVVARMEMNILINPNHADFALIKCGRETPIWWDKRLFDR